MRIASLSPAVTEIFQAIQQEEQLIFRAGSQLPMLEDICEQTPDIAIGLGEDCTNLVEELRGSHVQCMYDNPTTLEGYYGFVNAIGTMLDSEKKAREAVERLRQEMNSVREKSRKLPRRMNVLVLKRDGIKILLLGKWMGEIVYGAGGMRYVITPGNADVYIAPEKVDELQPDIVFLVASNAENEAALRAIAGLHGVSVHLLDPEMVKLGFALPEAMQRMYTWMFEALH